MTDFSELSRTWQQLHHLAPEAFRPVENAEDLARATAFLKSLDQEIGETPGHPLADLADTVMHRVLTYEAKHSPVPEADGPMMLAFYLEQRGLTQQQAAEATGIRQSTLSQLLRRKRAFTADHARALGGFFGVELGMFL